MKIDRQIGFEDISDEYREFVEKFKPKKTTDDCYTPPIVFEAIADYVEKRYGVSRDHFVRPFYPGEDYRRRNYPEDCIVVDNPPFSIISQIVNDYMKNGVHFFLFCPYLTSLGIGRGTSGLTIVVTSSDITYENGAKVNTSFVTNLEPGTRFRSDADLHDIIEDADRRSRIETASKPELPKYSYPANVVTSTMLGYLAEHGVSFSVRESESAFIRALDSQRAKGKSLFGAGFLISNEAAAKKEAAEKLAAENFRMEKAAAEKAAAEKASDNVWILSQREKDIIKSIGRKKE